MDQDLKHQCKFCSKRFACGRSLGGHVRSHMRSAGNANANANDVVEEEKVTVEGGRGYGLRENPRKSWRFSKSFDLGKDCGVCGKEFQSWRALFGHMRSHSVKVSKEAEVEDDVGGVEGSWSGGSHALVEVQRRKRRSCRSVSVSSSSSSELSYSKEQEDVAISLMMLSRDVGFGFSHFAKSPDKNSAAFDRLGNAKNKELELSDVLDVDCDDEINKSMADYLSDSDYFEVNEKFEDSVKKKKKKIGFNWIDTKVKMNSIVFASGSGSDPKKKISKYECATCNKSFDTHQALGGHRASHKRMKGACFAENNSLDAEDRASIDQGVGNEVAEKMKGNHQCLICGKFFGSGQALGGHKRSHFGVASPSTVVDVIQQDLIDLNLPAQVEEDSSKGSPSVVDAEYNLWWDASNLQH